jgi:hypothetical protein
MERGELEPATDPGSAAPAEAPALPQVEIIRAPEARALPSVEIEAVEEATAVAAGKIAGRGRAPALRGRTRVRCARPDRRDPLDFPQFSHVPTDIEKKIFDVD